MMNYMQTGGVRERRSEWGDHPCHGAHRPTEHVMQPRRTVASQSCIVVGRRGRRGSSVVHCCRGEEGGRSSVVYLGVCRWTKEQGGVVKGGATSLAMRLHAMTWRCIGVTLKNDRLSEMVLRFIIRTNNSQRIRPNVNQNSIFDE